METLKEFDIPAANIEWLREKLAKLNRRFKRVGQAGGIKLTVVREYVERRRSHAGDVQNYKYLVVTVEGESPKAQGWHLVAQLEHTEAGNIVRALPGKTADEAWRTADSSCAHCNAKRYRADTFLLQHEDGRLAQIGRNCIKDFLGNVAPEYYAQWATWSEEFENAVEEASDWSRVRPHYSLDEYLGWCAAVVRKEGAYMSRAQAKAQTGPDGFGPQTTASLAARYMHGDRHLQQIEPLEVTPEDEAKVAQVLAWFDAQEHRSDFMYNLKVVRDLDGIESRHHGFAAAMYGSWVKATTEAVEKAVEEKTGKTKAESQHFGTVGQREEFTLTYTSSKGFDTDYGMMYIERFADEHGNVAVWKTSTGIDADIIIGETFKVKATVKEHSEFRGVKETYLQRVKLGDKVQ